MANINFLQTEMKLFLFLFLCILNSQSTTFQIKTYSANNDGQDFDQGHMNWIDAGFEDRCPELRKEVMSRREIGDKIIKWCVRNPKKSQCRLFVYLWGFLDSEYIDMH